MLTAGAGFAPLLRSPLLRDSLLRDRNCAASGKSILHPTQLGGPPGPASLHYYGVRYCGTLYYGIETAPARPVATAWIRARVSATARIHHRYNLRSD